ncbi:hypothetical protein PoB_003401400 [Plakobranchus ocellatus]|uniref:Uncharacterized protein n=1 Tax=Plakobranchus ocellatus TaxID=259542 RepID=A0AAV4AMB6_9GAST|nr:hypothetical protein PoB_003401400 [Plakobranchus ocellatus]
MIFLVSECPDSIIRTQIQQLILFPLSLPGTTWFEKAANRRTVTIEKDRPEQELLAATFPPRRYPGDGVCETGQSLRNLEDAFWGDELGSNPNRSERMLLREMNYVGLTKCVLGARTINSLGHRIGVEAISLQDEKV